MFDRLISRFTLGFGLGYVVGARAGRERYDQIRGAWSSFIGNRAIQQGAQRGKELVSEVGEQVTSKLRDTKREPQDIREVMTAVPETVGIATTLMEVAAKMKEQDAGAMVVVDDAENVVGIVTDRDITIRAIAEGRDPKTTKVGDIASKAPTTLSPTDSVEEAIRLMRDKKIRRIPVVENGRPIGMVSLGDLAEERDPHSALADISRAAGTK